MIKMGPGWKSSVNRMARIQRSVLSQGSMLMFWAQKMGVQVARDQLDVYVYNAPLPPSAANDPNYLDRARLGRTRDAVKGREIMLGAFASQIFVDQSDYPAYYYAWTLENGGYFTRAGYYAARPFWRTTKMIMQIKLFHEARKRLWNIKMGVE